MDVTRRAASFLDRVREVFDLPKSAGVRIGAHPGRAGQRVDVAFVKTPWPDDVVVESSGIRVFVAPTIASALSKAILDVDETSNPPELVLRDRGGD